MAKSHSNKTNAQVVPHTKEANKAKGTKEAKEARKPSSIDLAHNRQEIPNENKCTCWIPISSGPGSEVGKSSVAHLLAETLGLTEAATIQEGSAMALAKAFAFKALDRPIKALKRPFKGLRAF